MNRVLHFLRRVPAAVAWRAELRTRKARERARKATAPLRLRPNFLVIGAQKSGTTALHAYLGAHPAVFCTSRKEVHYFSLMYPLGERWYLSHFPLRVITRPLAVGEATPAYLFDPRSPARVRAFDPGMKLVAVLRDPVERAYSHYWMERETRDETHSFEDALEWEQREVVPELERWIADPEYESRLPLFGRSYVSRGLYVEQLERWLELFPREQLLVFTSDELIAEPATTLAKVATFLGAPPVAPVSFPRENVREYEPMAAETRRHLRRVFEPHNRRLAELLGRDLPW